MQQAAGSAIPIDTDLITAKISPIEFFEYEMFLQFEGQAQLDRNNSGVMFAGRYLNEKGSERIVICRVTSEALAAKCGEKSLSPDRLLDAYRAFAGEINRIASALFEGGDIKPIVTASDISSRAA